MTPPTPVPRRVGGREITPAAQRWAEDAGRVLAEWYTSPELRASGIRANAYQRLSIASSVYLDGTGLEWPRGIEHFDTQYLMADVAFEAFGVRAAARLAAMDGPQHTGRGRRRSGGPDLYPHNQARARMEQYAIACLDIVHETEMDQDEARDYVAEYIPDKIRATAWRILVPEWQYTNEPRRWEEPPIHALSSAADREFAAEVRWRNGLLDAYEVEATALAEHGITVLNRTAASRGVRVGSGLVGEPPPAQPFGVSPQGAERLAAAWMEHLGASGVAVTRTTKDGGLDIEADRFVAQVKAWAGPVGVVEVRALAGVAAHDKHARKPLFFATTGYTGEALAFAEHTAGMALFVMDAEHGQLTGVTPEGVRLRAYGLWEAAGAR